MERSWKKYVFRYRLAFIFCFLLFGFSAYSQSGIRVITYNIRYDEPNDGPDQWKHRKQALAGRILEARPDFLGTQEGLDHQVSFLDEALEAHDFIGVGRDDGQTKGEFTALFYDRSEWELLSHEIFWLSESPGEVSIGWDAACNRTATIGVFRNSQGDTVAVCNTHMDHMGIDARKNSVRLVLEKLRHIGSGRLVLMGDFNFTPDDLNYAVITGEMKDARALARDVREAHPGTYNGFERNGIFDRRIDYIFISGKDVQVDTYQMPDWRHGKNRHVSDHFPVILEMKIE